MNKRHLAGLFILILAAMAFAEVAFSASPALLLDEKYPTVGEGVRVQITGVEEFPSKNSTSPAVMDETGQSTVDMEMEKALDNRYKDIMLTVTYRPNSETSKTATIKRIYTESNNLNPGDIVPAKWIEVEPMLISESLNSKNPPMKKTLVLKNTFDKKGALVWKPLFPGITTLTAWTPEPKKNPKPGEDAIGRKKVAEISVATQFASTPTAGVVVMCLAGLLLFGGAILSMRRALMN